jgi:regulator of sigma D
MRKVKQILLGIAASGLTACASVPPEAAELSRIAGQRVAALQAAHEAAITSYFELSRQRVEDFLDNRWVPQFLADFVPSSGLLQMMDTSRAKGQMLLQFSQAAIQQIELQRASLIEPLEAMERQTLRELRQSYAELNQIQSSLTAFVTSAQKVKATEDNVLKRLSLLSARDSAVNKAVSLNDKVVRLTASTDKATDIIKKLQDELSNLKP